MKNHLLSIALASVWASSFLALPAAAAPLIGAKAYTYSHKQGETDRFLSEIVSFDSGTNTLWVAGVTGVDVLDAATGAFKQRIDTTAFGSINSVAISNGVAAFAIESSVRTNPGVVKLYDTNTRTLLSGINSIAVGALPDMLTFTKDGTRLLVANEATPSVYGPRLADSDGHRNYGPAAVDPVGSVSIIDIGSRTVTSTPTLVGVAQTGSNIRTNTGMDFEPEYIAVNAAGTKAYVTLQEANAIGVLNLQTQSFEKVVGLGTKDFNAVGNRIDPLDNNDGGQLINVAVKGLYMPDGIAAYEAGGSTFLVMANEGDFREDDADRSAAGAASPLNRLRISNTDSSPGDLYAAGARSFSIRDVDGNLVYDSGEILDREAIAAGIYDDGRSRDKGVEPEGVELITIGDRTFAFIGLERTTTGAVAVFDITTPEESEFIQLLVSDDDSAPEGLEVFALGGAYYLAFANEGSNTTSVYQLVSQIPEPGTYGLALAGLGLLAATTRRRRKS